METNELILVETFCTHHHVEISFISSLEESGLLEITRKEDVLYIPEVSVKAVEQFVRLHNDLNINLEGIEAITHLLHQLEQKETEISQLRNRLRFFDI